MSTVERLGPEAVERVRSLRLRALRDAPDAFWRTVAEEEAIKPVQWRERLARTDTATFVAVRAGEDVGLVVGTPHRERDGEAQLVSMWVAPRARGEGVADALVTAVVQWARAAGFRRLLLDVADANEPAIGLYARHGFVPTGVTGTLPAPREHVTEHERALDLASRDP